MSRKWLWRTLPTLLLCILVTVLLVDKFRGEADVR